MAIIVYLDTYAFHEMIVGNPHYEKFKKGYAIITTRLNLMELFYGLLIKFSEGIANEFYDYFLPNTIEIDDPTIKQAMLFRKQHKEKQLSYIDCIGYILAQQRDVPFVTGDRQFENINGVEFLK